MSGDFTGPSDPTSTTQRSLRRAPEDVLRRTHRAYDRVGQLTWVGTLACVPLGIWHDGRWLATAVFLAVGWVGCHLVSDLIETELERRRAEAAAACPDVVEGD